LIHNNLALMCNGFFRGEHPLYACFSRPYEPHQHKLELNVEQMRSLSLNILERTTRGVKKRKSRSAHEMYKS